MLEFHRGAFLDAIDEMREQQQRVQYILDLTESAAIIAAPQTQLDFHVVLQRLRDLEESYRKRIDGAESTVDEYDRTERLVFHTLSDAGDRMNMVFR